MLSESVGECPADGLDAKMVLAGQCAVPEVTGRMLNPLLREPDDILMPLSLWSKLIL